MRTYRIIIPILMTVLLILAVGLFFAPRFLVYSTGYAKADAVIVLLGPDFNARQAHAKNLIYKRMASYLIIPAYDKTYRLEQGTIKALSPDLKKNNLRKDRDRLTPKYYEDTHLELIKAEEMMNDYGQKSAIFVSSPYHMRRIQIIVNNEFDSFSRFYFSPTPFERAPVDIWQLKTSDWKKVGREYVKILWFILYSPWTK